VAATPQLASLAGRVAVVTGAANGIGAATAASLAAFGADLVLCDRDGDHLDRTVSSLEASGRSVSGSVLDVRNPDAVHAWLEPVERVDVLVNNAGGTFRADFLDISPRGQQALVDENFTSVTTLIRTCVPLMPAGSSIVNVTSVEAFRAAPGFSVYAAMKAAVEQLTRTLALELCDRGIRVNAVAPDGIPTPGDASLAAEVGWADYGPIVPLGFGTPDDCAAAIVFLAGGLARFMTGNTLHVDGGTDAARGWRRAEDGRWRP
jgi:NAD(P)-dependent dehydrogenase (short-subunit alcohol dehydrogenase family)